MRIANTEKLVKESNLVSVYISIILCAWFISSNSIICKLIFHFNYVVLIRIDCLRNLSFFFFLHFLQGRRSINPILFTFSFAGVSSKSLIHSLSMRLMRNLICRANKTYEQKRMRKNIEQKEKRFANVINWNFVDVSFDIFNTATRIHNAYRHAQRKSC